MCYSINIYATDGLYFIIICYFIIIILYFLLRIGTDEGPVMLLRYLPIKNRERLAYGLIFTIFHSPRLDA